MHKVKNSVPRHAVAVILIRRGCDYLLFRNKLTKGDRQVLCNLWTQRGTYQDYISGFPTYSSELSCA